MKTKALVKFDESTSDRRLQIAEMIVNAPEDRLHYLIRLFPEFFSIEPAFGSLEYAIELNTSYHRWIEDTGVTREWLTDFPTSEIYYRYLRYTMENRMSSMSKSLFFKTLEVDFNMRE